MTTAIAIRPKQLPLLTGFTHLGYYPPKKTTIKQWGASGKALGLYGRALQWNVGDWANFGEAQFGEDHAQYLAEISATFPPHAIRHYAKIAKIFPIDKRIPELSFTHHERVSHLELPAALKILKKAASSSWTVEEMLKYMRGEDPEESRKPKSASAPAEPEGEIDVVVELNDGEVVKIIAKKANFKLEQGTKNIATLQIGGRKFLVDGSNGRLSVREAIKS